LSKHKGYVGWMTANSSRVCPSFRLGVSL